MLQRERRSENDLEAWVMNCFCTGASREAIVAKLVQAGYEPQLARDFVAYWESCWKGEQSADQGAEEKANKHIFLGILRGSGALPGSSINKPTWKTHAMAAAIFLAIFGIIWLILDFGGFEFLTSIGLGALGMHRYYKTRDEKEGRQSPSSLLTKSESVDRQPMKSIKQGIMVLANVPLFILGAILGVISLAIYLAIPAAAIVFLIWFFTR